ncbi:hypothetical protein NDU88_005054 [Pleurodeles waltl]|uniref:Uncharacterized protein n=1 Tax=Pleurodeles waltl TaxID=8319 RepID=A0AAV7WU51_PLEWA|nr:hypothetical protein NDU88_005054 [Pleurodeles waltl]
MGCEVNALAWHTVAVGGRRPLYEPALVNIEPYGIQEPMTMCAGGRGTHRRGERPSENRHLRAIAKEVRALGVYTRRGTHCRKRWEDIRCGTRKTAESLLGMASRPRRGASRTLTPLMSRILAVAYPDLDGRLRTSQQTQGASSGGGELASEHEGAASHNAPVGTGTDTEGTSDLEGEGSTTTGTGEDTSDTDTSSFGSSLAVAATSGPPASTGTAATQRSSSALPAAPQPSLRAHSPRKAGVSFAPGTSAPAPVTSAALSAELIDLVRTLIVGQTTLLNAIQGVEREVHWSNAYLEGIHSGTAEQGPAVQKSTAEEGPAVKTGTAEQGPAVQKSTAEEGPAVKTGTAEEGPAVKTGTAEQGPAVQKSTAEQGPAVKTGTAEEGPAVKTGTAEEGPAAKTGTAEEGPAVKTGTAEQGPTVQKSTAEQGPPCRRAPLNRAPP